MSCEIFLNLGGSNPLKFSSNRELDTFLWDHRFELLRGSRDVDGEVFYDTSRKGEMVARLENAVNVGKKIRSEMYAAYDEWNRHGRTTAAPNPRLIPELSKLSIGIGLSDLYAKVGGRDMEQPVEPDPEIRSLTPEQLKYRQKFGSDVHAIIEAKLKGGTPKLEILTIGSSLYNQVSTEVDKMLTAIKERHKKNGKLPNLLSEVDLCSKTLDPNFEAIVKATSHATEPLKTSYGIGTIDQIAYTWGRADLIVIDDDGDVFVYDFKTKSTPIQIGGKYNAKNEMNLASYAAFLRQWDVDATTGGFAEMIVDYGTDGLSARNIRFSEIKPYYGGVWNDLASTYYPSNVRHATHAANELDDIMENIVPNNTFMNQHKLQELTVSAEMSRAIPISDGEAIQRYKPGAKYKYHMPYAKIPTGVNRNWLYGNWIVGSTKEELQNRIEEYVRLSNEESHEVLPAFAEAIINATSTGDLVALTNTLRSLSPTYFNTILTEVRRYVTNKWTLLNDDFLIQNGFFIFQKPGSSMIEVMMLDTHVLNMSLSFSTNPNDSTQKDPRRTSVLGNFIPDSDIDPLFFMKGTVGNAVLLKGMIYFNQHPEILGGNKILRMKAVSTLDAHVVNVTNLELGSTYRRLVQEYNKKVDGPKLKELRGILEDPVTAAIKIAGEIIEHASEEEVRNLLNYKAFKKIGSTLDYTIEDLEKMLEQIQRSYPDMDSSRMSVRDDIQMAKKALQDGFLQYNLIYAKSEEDIGRIFNKGIAMDGASAASMKESGSVILRNLQRIISGFYDLYKQEYVRLSAEWQHAYDAFKKEASISPLSADDFKYFRDNWFLKDGDEIHKLFRLIPEDSNYWIGKPAEKKLYDLYLKFWNRFMYDDDLKRIQLAKSDGSYYEVPLIKTNFKKQLEAGGFWDSIKGAARRAKNAAAGLLFDLEDDTFERREEAKREMLKLPSYIQDFVGEKRLAALEKNGTSAYETNMDIVALTMIAVGLKRQMSKHTMMLTTALRASAYYSRFVDGYTITNILEAMDKQIDAKLFNRSVIDRFDEGVAMFASIVKSITSTTAIAWSWKSFTRESLRGILDAISRTKLDEMYSGKFNTSDYLDALKLIMESVPSNAKPNTFMMQLSHHFGMANFSQDQVVQASKSNPFGFYELGRDVMFITATWPDFIHRTAMLVAHLKHIGAYDAYYMDENEVLRYDMTKDQRFQTYLKYKDDEGHIPESEKFKYANEKTLYLELLKDFDVAGARNESGGHLKEGDLLPTALSPRTQDNLKTVADKLYGNYDKETKSAMQEGLLGSLFFQFKTYPLERLAQWFKAPTHVNDIEFVQQYWDDGEPVVIYLSDDGREWIHGRERDINPDWLINGRAMYYKVMNGHMVEGHINRMIALGGYLWHHNQSEFENTWKTNPYFRGQVGLALYDTFFGVILAFLIRMLFGEDKVQNMKNEEWYTRWLYAVGTGMTQDGPVWGLLSSIVGNGAPPSLSIIRSYMTNAHSVIFGDASVAYGIFNSLGATREFTSILTDN